MAEITNSITGTIEKIQTTDGVSHPLNATYLNGIDSSGFLSTDGGMVGGSIAPYDPSAYLGTDTYPWGTIYALGIEATSYISTYQLRTTGEIEAGTTITLGKNSWTSASDPRYGSFELLFPFSTDNGTTWKYSSIKAEGSSSSGGWHNLVFTGNTTDDSDSGGVYFSADLSTSGCFNTDQSYMTCRWNDVAGGVKLTFPSTAGTLALTSDITTAKNSAISTSESYTNNKLASYCTMSAFNSAAGRGPYKFVKMLDNGVKTSQVLTVPSYVSVSPSSVTATITASSSLWQNTVDNTYKILMDISCTNLTECNLSVSKSFAPLGKTYACFWRMPLLYTENCCPAAAAQIDKWPATNWWASDLTGRVFLNTITSIGTQNANGSQLPIIAGSSGKGVYISAAIIEFDGTYSESSLPVYGFSYHSEILTDKTSLLYHLRLLSSDISVSSNGSYTISTGMIRYHYLISVHNRNGAPVTCYYAGSRSEPSSFTYAQQIAATSYGTFEYYEDRSEKDPDGRYTIWVYFSAGDGYIGSYADSDIVSI